MSTLKVKIFLLKNELTLAGMARDLATAERGEVSTRVMLSQMVNGRRFYPSLAKRVQRKYGLELQKSEARERAA